MAGDFLPTLLSAQRTPGPMSQSAAQPSDENDDDEWVSECHSELKTEKEAQNDGN